jgi:peptide/nickel transport system substrate-binding protein
MILILLVGCSGDIDTASNEENKDVEIDYMIVEGGEVVLPLTPFNTLNPLMTNNLSYYYFSKLIYEGLFEFNEKLEPIPQLAESYNISNDGKTITVKLRNDVFWHDGEKFTAEDVVFTINTLINSKAKTSYDDIFSKDTRIINAKIIDQHQVEIFFENSSYNILESLTFPIIPSHRFVTNKAQDGYVNALQLDGYIPIGTGPFKYGSYDKYKSIKLEAYDGYRFGQPSIKYIIGKVLDNNELFITAFEAGQINLTPVSGVNWDRYKENSRIIVLEYVSNDYEFLGFNFNNQLMSGDKGAAIRKAINYAINRQEIIQKIYLGHATQVDVPLHPNSWLLSEDAVYYGYNPTQSNKILQSAGFTDLDGDSILEDNEGKKLSFRLITNPTNINRFRTAEMIREDLKEVGIEIILDFNTSYVSSVELDEKLNDWQKVNDKLLSGDYDIVLSGWQLSLTPDLYDFFHSNQIGINNFINYNNQNMDELLTNLNNYSHGSKLSSFKTIQDLIIEDLPYISLYFRNKAILVDSKIKGELSPNVFNLYKGLERCFIALVTD